MSHSLSDTVRNVEASIPGAKVLNAKHFSDPAGVQAAERGTKGFRERVKRTTDEEFGGQKHKPGRVQSACADHEAWWLRIGVGVDEPKVMEFHEHDPRSGRLTDRVYMTWTEADYKKHECDSCKNPVYQTCDMTDRDVWVCDKCRYTLGLLHENESGSKWRLHHKSMTLRHLGGMEFSNENLGGIMGAHGSPDVADAMRRSGVLQTRRDENGNAVETAVFSSRRDMESKVKMFNRMQKDAEARGFRGTRGGVKYIRHAGGTPD